MNLDIKIISYALYDKKFLLQLKTEIKDEYIHPNYRKLYKTIIYCFNKYKEVPTAKVLNEVMGDDWLNYEDIFNDAISEEIDSKEYPFYVEKCKKRYNAQLITTLYEEIYKGKSTEDVKENLEEINQKIKEKILSVETIYKSKAFKEGSLKRTASDAWAEYKHKKENPDVAKGVMSGYSDLDKITNGFHPSELILIGGESGAGKSALAMNMGVNAWLGSNKVPDTVEDVDEYVFTDDGANVLYFTIEMPFEVLRRRVDACAAGIALNGVRDGTLTETETEKYKSVLKFQGKYEKEFYIIDVPRGCSVAYIEARYLELINSFQPDLIIVDYIGIMKPSDNVGQDWLDIGSIAEELHEFCRTYKVPVISPVQLNRPQQTASGKKPPPDQHRIARSSMVPQNANIALLIETRQDEYVKQDMPIRIGKMRDGEQGGFVLFKRLDQMRILDGTPEFEEQDGYGEGNS